MARSVPNQTLHLTRRHILVSCCMSFLCAAGQVSLVVRRSKKKIGVVTVTVHCQRLGF